MARGTTDKPFGEAITDLMAEREMSGRELARRADLGAGGATISHFVRAYINPDFETMERIARALEVPASFFPEYRLEEIRRSIDWHAPRDQMPSGRGRQLKRALRKARSLGLNV